MPSARLLRIALLGTTVALLLTGCAGPEPVTPAATSHADTATATQTETTTAAATGAFEPLPAAELESISVQAMPHQPVPVQMQQCLVQLSQWIDLEAATSSPDLFTRLAAFEQKLLFLLPDSLGGFDNSGVSAGGSPSGTVVVAVVGSAAEGDDGAAIWRELRRASAEVDAAAASIEAEGVEFEARLVEFSYAQLCTTQLAVFALPLWQTPSAGLQSARMDLETNRIEATVNSAALGDDRLGELLQTGPEGIFALTELR